MFADYIKMAAKTALIALAIAAILVVIQNIYFPTFDVTALASAVGTGKAILQYYCGDFYGLLVLGVALLGLRFVGIPLLRLALLIFKVPLKINE